jgi:hypothetical protein
MRNLLALLAALLLVVSGTGLWRGWYRIESLSAEEGKSAFRVEIDRTKIADDVIRAARGIVRTLGRGEQKETSTEQPAK